MRKFPFESVTVETKKIGAYRNITSVEEAAEFLLTDWPARHGPTYLAARQVSLDTMEGTRTIDEARAAFIEAAKAADIFIREGN
ncbi:MULTISPECIES: DUF982 domain-containing protein [Phyllobacterium]|jgi:Protein of unknown function (DUF982)|uniref:DUF982 domain-containing protein n=1 Tax=Phyllobacterium TaxID=28100 RepID=UPI001CBF3EBB|nr:DUF982 domain-containing protein [Phyllobacterium calauticae]MBZ3695416.1 DUF982 domain-containing protein [Phyllobacterium calauticae]